MINTPSRNPFGLEYKYKDPADDTPDDFEMRQQWYLEEQANGNFRIRNNQVYLRNNLENDFMGGFTLEGTNVAR